MKKTPFREPINFAIIDNHGIIDSGTEKEMEITFDYFTMTQKMFVREYDNGVFLVKVIKERIGRKALSPIKLVQILKEE